MTSETLVLIPPILCDARVFAPQMSAISAQHSVLFAVTRHGERISEIASTILDSAPSRFALAGMGMGGMIAMELFRRAPGRITRIALIATNPQADTPDVAANREPLIIAARAGRMNDVIAHELAPAALAPTANRPEVAALVQDMAHGLGPTAYVKQARAMQRRPDQQDVLRKIKVPALIMCGDHDTQNTVRRHEFMADMIPYAKLEVLPDAAHLPTLERPNRSTAILQSWMAEPFVLR
ncbi:alpha/beta fold hydrolase [Yoonia sp. 208BN28-4]|uniref:alpha/beta fold hydrolase n=1 Tax=Yoonia sp. 208BN28-4 TaxID=3126505 RepID=UPI00309C2069